MTGTRRVLLGAAAGIAFAVGYSTWRALIYR